VFFFRANEFVSCCFGGFGSSDGFGSCVGCVGSVLSVDFGTRKIGLAVADIETKIAFPKGVLVGNWNNLDGCVDVLIKKVEEFKINALIFGYPLTMEGGIRDNCINVLYIAEKIASFYKKKQRGDFPILFFDERFSTKAVYSSGFGEIISKKTNGSDRERKASFAKNKTKDKSKQYKFGLKKVNADVFDDDKSACLMLNEVLASLK